MSDRFQSYGAPFEPAVTSEPVTTRVRPDLNALRRSTVTAAARKIARLLLPTFRGLSDRKAIRLIGALVLGLTLLAMGFVLGQGGTESSETGASVAGQDQLATPLVTYAVGETTKDGWIHSSFVSSDCL